MTAPNHGARGDARKRADAASNPDSGLEDRGDAANDLAELRALLDAATGVGRWHWAGNTDAGEPYLATWLPGAGRCQVLAIGEEDRSTTGRAARDVREYAEEVGMDPDEAVNDWAFDRYDQPVKEPRLWFYTDLMAHPARENVVFEVAPEATSRDDKRVYRADIIGIRHPDAELIVAAVNALPALLDRLERAEARVAAVEALAHEQSTFPGQCCPGLCLTGLHDLDADTLTAFREVIRAALEGTK